MQEERRRSPRQSSSVEGARARVRERGRKEARLKGAHCQAESLGLRGPPSLPNELDPSLFIFLAPLWLVLMKIQPETNVKVFETVSYCLGMLCLFQCCDHGNDISWIGFRQKTT